MSGVCVTRMKIQNLKTTSESGWKSITAHFTSHEVLSLGLTMEARNTFRKGKVLISWSPSDLQCSGSSSDTDHFTLLANTTIQQHRCIVISLPHLIFTVQADCGARQPLPELCVDKASGARDPSLHGEARDAARSRVLSLTLRILSGQGDLCNYLKKSVS